MTESQPVPSAPPRSTGRSWKRWLAYTAIVVAVVIAGGWVGAAFVPRWWSQRVADRVEGSIWSGSSLGVFYGFVFTLLPLVVVAWAFRKRRSWKAWLAFAALAIVLALPNLFTLGIVLGGGNAAHAGERTLDVEAPGFRNGTAVGAILAVLAFGVLWWLLRSRRSARRELERMRAEAREHAEPAASDDA
jgi:cbb3-type cytochrome oxidase subunit 3